MALRISPKAWLVLADACTLSLAMVVSYWIRATLGTAMLDGALSDHLLVGLVALPAWLCFFARGRLYNARFIDRRTDEPTHRVVDDDDVAADDGGSRLAADPGVAAPGSRSRSRRH